MSESDVQRLCIGWLKTQGIYCWRNNTTGIFDPVAQVFLPLTGVGALTGVADILGILPNGRFLAVEVKSQTGRISKDQQSFLEAIKQNKGVACVVRSLDDLKEFFRGI